MVAVSLDHRRGWALWLSVVLLLAGAALTAPYGDFQQVGTVPLFWRGMGVMGLGFIVAWRLRQIPALWFWGVAAIARLLLLPMVPGDDVWRYLWEGYIQNLGFSPYHFAPTAAELIPFRTDWWPLINHADVSAIYPPMTQLGFRAMAAIAPSVLLFKLGFVLADLGVCWLLWRRWGDRQSLLYAWNPLVIYSFAGGAHYDSWFLLPLVGAWLWCDQRDQSHAAVRWLSSALLLGISIAVKWMSVPVLGWLVWQALRQRRGLTGWLVGGLMGGLILVCGLAPMVLSALPFCTLEACPLIPTGSVFVSYGRSAELVPHLLSLVWPASQDANWIYLLPLGATVLWLLRCRTMAQFAEWYFACLLVLSPIVHAWYFTWLMPFGAVSRNQGIRLVSLSALVYFALPLRLALGNPDWRLTDLERGLLWLPLIVGWLWTLTDHPAVPPAPIDPQDRPHQAAETTLRS